MFRILSFFYLRDMMRIRWKGGLRMRIVTSLNDVWQFHKGDIDVPFPTDKNPVYMQSKVIRKNIGPAAFRYYDVDDGVGDGSCEMHNEGWRRINVPHDYIIGQRPVETENNTLGFFKYDNAWYRKHFTVPEEARNKRVTLEFDGIAGEATVWLNGCLMRHHFCRYTSFEVDISDVCRFGEENVLAVYINGKCFEGWWYQGAGIYRDVRMVVTERVSIDQYGVYAPTEKIDEHTWHVNLQTTVRNDFEEESIVSVTTRILDAEGLCVGEATENGMVAFRDKTTLCYTAKVTDPHLWDTETPYLYTVETSLCVAGEEWDRQTVRIGFRTIRLDPEKGFFLNDKHTIIKGVNCHQDFGLMGLVLPRNIARYKVELIKSMGANGYRCSHYPHPSATMDALDELGMLAYCETRWYESTPEGIEALEMLIKRDRNRPSVIFWSTGNEEYCHVDDMGQRIHRTLRAVIRKLDDTRFITTAQCLDPCKSTVFEDCDVISLNYALGTYDACREKFPNKALVASENCAVPTIRGWYLPSNGKNRIQDVDCGSDATTFGRGREYTWRHLMSYPWVIGGYQWDSIEHRGEAAWPMLCSKAGAIDMFFQKKGAYYQNKSHWTTEPMVHIVPHWNWNGLEGEEILVPVYTNGDAVELFLNGQSLGKQILKPYGHGEWRVPFEAGTLKAVAYRNGDIVATHERVTTKAPVKLKLTPNNTFTNSGEDVALFTCECVDEDGRVVENATPFVRFSTTNQAMIVGTGSDNCDHEPVTLPDRRMYAGKILVGVRPVTNASELVLYAQSEGLAMACARITF